MSFRIKSGIASLFALVALTVIGTSPASATTFCVPDFFAACPDNGTNVAHPNLQTTMVTNSSDGEADKVFIGEHVATDINAFIPTGTDPLTITGSGPDKSVMTSSDNGNGLVVQLNTVTRRTDLKDLTIRIPATFSDNSGSGITANKGTFDNVDIESRNPGSNAVATLAGDTTWKNGRIYGTSNGTIGAGFIASPSAPGTAQILNMSIEDSNTGIMSDDAEEPIVLKQSQIIEPTGFALQITDGALLEMENSIIRAPGNGALRVKTDNDPGDSDIEVNIRNSTIVADGDTSGAAVDLEIENAAGSNNADINVRDSIVRSFDNTWNLDLPEGPGKGQGRLLFTDSNFEPSGTPNSTGVDLDDDGNINADPKFTAATDFRLQQGSPSIDAGSPAAGGPLVDFAGSVRPQDGDGNGSAVSDQGAFESPKLAACANTPSLCPKPIDKVRPKIAKVRFKAPTKARSGSLGLNVSEAARVKSVFTPKPKNGRKTFVLVRNKKANGTLKTVIRKGKLKKGKYLLTIVATDKAGNKSKKVVRTVNVK